MQTQTLGTGELSEWYEYYDQLPEKGPYHNPTYLSLLEGHFEFPTEAVRLFVLVDDDEFVYYPYFCRPLSETAFDPPDLDVEGLFDIVSSWYYGGPLLSNPERTDLAEGFIDEFSAYCREEGIVAEFVRFDPNIRNDQDFPALNPESNRQTVHVDLIQSLDAIWDDFSSSNRTHIRNARDAGFNVIKANDHDHVAAFHDIYSDAMEAKGASEHYRFSLEFFVEMVLDNPEIATLLISRYEDDIVGGSYLVHDGPTVNEYLRASDPDLWDLGLNNHLCYCAIEHMHERQFSRFDFQGGRPGVFQFKKAFSSDRGEFYTAQRIHDQASYDRLVESAADHGINTDTDYFPAYRKGRSN